MKDDIKWQKPSIEAIKHHYIVGLFYIEDEEDNENKLAIDIFTFHDIDNTFWGSSGYPRLKLKDLELWYPLPRIPENLNGGHPYV